MVKKAVSCVLASLRPSTYLRGYASALRSLRPRLWKGASWRTGVGWVRTATFLTTLHRYPEMCLKSA